MKKAPFDINHWQDDALSVEELIAKMPAKSSVFVHGTSMTPTTLIDAMCKAPHLEDVTVYHLHLDGEIAFAKEGMGERFHSNSLFTGAQLRAPIARGEADFVPIFLREVPRLFTQGFIKLNVALLQLSPPDEHGMCTLGTSVDAAIAATKHADLVLAEINMQAPRSMGYSFIPFSALDGFTITDHPIHCHPKKKELSDVENAIGEHIAELIEDGSTMQMGIGAIPDAVLRRLGNKHDLGIHTEMFSDGVIPLVEGGVITNRYKKVHPWRITTSFVVGTQRVYDFCNQNSLVEFHPCDRTNDTSIISKNPKVVAVNSAIQIDLSGQICADSMGFNIFSGIGGQMDFMHGAACSEGGKPIIAFPSTAKSGQISRITTQLNPGAGVVTTRGHVHWVVTEYGAVNLFGKNLRQRAEALISIAHPDFRAELAREINGIRHFNLS